MIKQGKMQIGKSGLTDNFISNLRNTFMTHENMRISVLKSAGHEKAQVTEFNKKILEALGQNFTSKVIGFTIVIKKWRKAKW